MEGFWIIIPISFPKALEIKIVFSKLAVVSSVNHLHLHKIYYYRYLVSLHYMQCWQLPSTFNVLSLSFKESTKSIVKYIYISSICKTAFVFLIIEISTFSQFIFLKFRIGIKSVGEPYRSLTATLSTSFDGSKCTLCNV